MFCIVLETIENWPVLPLFVEVHNEQPRAADNLPNSTRRSGLLYNERVVLFESSLSEQELGKWKIENRKIEPVLKG